MRNPFQKAVYPPAGELEAVLDTGYSGFLFVPEKTFDILGLPRSKRGTGVLADGTRLETYGAFATLEFPAQRVTLDGLVQTAEGASEVLLGMEGVRKVYIRADACSKRVSLGAC